MSSALSVFTQAETVDQAADEYAINHSFLSITSDDAAEMQLRLALRAELRDSQARKALLHQRQEARHAAALRGEAGSQFIRVHHRATCRLLQPHQPHKPRHRAIHHLPQPL